MCEGEGMREEEEGGGGGRRGTLDVRANFCAFSVMWDVCMRERESEEEREKKRHISIQMSQ